MRTIHKVRRVLNGLHVLEVSQNNKQACSFVEGSTSNAPYSSISSPSFYNRLFSSILVNFNACADWLCFLYRWIVSALSFGTVLCIKNESEEDLTLYIKTKFADATGFGDWTWHLYQKGWSYIPEKAKYWRIEPQRRTTFMLPFCTCLVVLGTESNFTYFLIHDARAPGERFATIWTTCHSFIPRFVRVTSDLVVTTKLRIGQANASKPTMQEAFKQSGLFKAVPNLSVLPRVMLPSGSPVMIGPSLQLPQTQQEKEPKSGFLSFGLVSKATDLVNEATAFVELFHIDKIYRLLFGIYLFLQIQIWNCHKTLSSPLPQGKYGENEFWLSRDYDASTVFGLQAVPGGLQAILVLIVSKPRSGAQLLSVLLAFANLVLLTTAACSSASEEALKLLKTPQLSRRAKYFVFFIPFVLFMALPACLLAGYAYYYESGSTVDFVVASLVVFGMHVYQICNLQKIDACLKGITPVLVVDMIKRAVSSIANIVSKFQVESFVAFLAIVAVVLNAVILFVTKERSL